MDGVWRGGQRLTSGSRHPSRRMGQGSARAGLRPKSSSGGVFFLCYLYFMALPLFACFSAEAGLLRRMHSRRTRPMCIPHPHISQKLDALYTAIPVPVVTPTSYGLADYSFLPFTTCEMKVSKQFYLCHATEVYNSRFLNNHGHGTRTAYPQGNQCTRTVQVNQTSHVPWGGAWRKLFPGRWGSGPGRLAE